LSKHLRVASLAALALTAAVGLTGCNTSPGAAALVGADRISVASLQRVVTRALANPQAQSSLGKDRAGFARTELGRLINNRIVAAAAAKYHVVVTANDIDAQIAQFAQQAGGVSQLEQQAAEGGVPKAELRDFIRYYVMEQKVGDAVVADVPVSASQLQAAYRQNLDSFDQVHSAHILVKSKALADRLLSEVRRNPSRFAALAQQYSIDTNSKPQGGDLGFAGRGQFVAPFSAAIFAAKPNTFVEVHSQFGWHVVHVIAHRHVTLAQAAPQLKAQILKGTRERLLTNVLAAEAKKLGVHVNPRYGRWSPTERKVVPAPSHDQLSVPSPTAGH
jgi:parvulin-like peptidyl-prolyl isomerase